MLVLSLVLIKKNSHEYRDVLYQNSESNFHNSHIINLDFLNKGTYEIVDDFKFTGR